MQHFNAHGKSQRLMKDSEAAAAAWAVPKMCKGSHIADQEQTAGTPQTRC